MEHQRNIQRERAKRLRKRKRRQKILIIKTGIFVILLVAFVSMLYGIKQQREAEKNAEQETTKQQMLKDREQKIEESLDMVERYYESYLAARKDTAEENIQTKDFSQWLYENYLDSDYEKLFSFVEAKILDDKYFYDEIGESTHVLHDRYQGRVSGTNHIYERTGKTEGEAEITIAGDICFAEDGYVLDKYDTVNDLSQCISPYLLDIMNQTDIFYLNHEYCVSERGTPLENKYYTFRAKPERMELLKEMSTDLVSLANNHVYDYGSEAMLDTLQYLKEADIPYVGGGANLEEATEPIYFIVNGMKIGFVAASNAEVNKRTPQATEDSPGILRAYDTTIYNQVIQEAADQCDYLIAYMHWGTEDSNYLNDLQQEQGREFLNSGADIVVGGHPHVLQGMEYVDGKPIVYSLGDFWFNKETKYTGMLKLNITMDGLKEMSFVPCLQTGFTTQYLSEADDQEELYSFLEKLSINIDIDENGVITEKQ